MADIAISELSKYGLFFIQEENDLIVPIPFESYTRLGLFDIISVDECDFLIKHKAGAMFIPILHGGCLIVPSKDLDAVNHELQHLFDNLILVQGNMEEREYRAFLAELAFTQSPHKRYILSMGAIQPEFLPLIILHDDYEDQRKKTPSWVTKRFWENKKETPHAFAMEKILMEFEKAGKMSSVLEVPPKSIITQFSMKLLNDAYKELYGLTYNEILGPFRK
jgi:hypothetical protein